ncbi:DUF4296 domain-containing protein [bacterium]|nr:DUF4296 domain-containing protein [bacterium]
MKPDAHRAFRKGLAVVTLLGPALAIIACKHETARSPLEPEFFAKIYTEMVVQAIDSTAIDSLSHLPVILNKHAVTQEQFEASQTYFDNHPDLWLEVFGHIETNLKKIKADRDNQMLQPADSLK